ncbi:orotidine-5'-phosphate decarboxylase [Halobacillus halophilus]|uniref:Orotidine 5'-phosphate decarboxylase n=1 Tax=Halobacillus halophilus (strain ATCC 35676 / DSM 2266 / JCM 20832 / KCTC 3685 / LMG 17431 / NBRC 102448 / NCIMB 2269) TaxID=866895 RepID=I0JM80_HALH3|nr:orotidine-5'-phosphate decarboxylase [Halobacillus halophilus]ASF39338.1 orotidine-5'-phosphate decarboxylase [Halobacillus halophilus]CCG45250.1 orotidine 5'-phosphate decarboxylase [Halobacillus halophilus DSM 2266]
MKQLRPVYFALDFEKGEEALHFLQSYQLGGIPVKVGMELFYREGPQIIQQLKENHHPVFLDLKLHDIPKTVQRAMANLARLGVDVVNVHAQGGSDMIQAAREGLEQVDESQRPLLLAVTILTSSDAGMIQNELLLSRSLESMVVHYAEMAEQNGADGVVCSVKESRLIKEAAGKEFYTLTPGIRLPSGEMHDQKRVATPEEAKKEQSNSIVVGRAIRDAKDPRHAYETVKEAFTNG